MTRFGFREQSKASVSVLDRRDKTEGQEVTEREGGPLRTEQGSDLGDTGRR